MPIITDYDRSPGTVPATTANFGEIVLIDEDEHELGHYQITPSDVVHLAVMAAYEGGYPYLTMWAMVQRVGALIRRARGESYFSGVIERYSAPINPAFSQPFRPEPNRATVNCREFGRDRRFISEARPQGRFQNVQQTSRGPLPSRGLHGIPVSPGSFIYNKVMCSSGRLPETHGNDNRNGARRLNQNRMRDCVFGSTDEVKNREWRGWGKLNEVANCREAAWKMAQAIVGNPIPGWDNWYGYRYGRSTGKNIVDFSAIPSGTRDARRMMIESEGGRERNRKVWAKFGLRGASSNIYEWRAWLQPGDLVYIRHGSVRDTRQPILLPYGHLSGFSDTSISQAPSTRTRASSSSGAVERTQSSSAVESGGRAQSTSSGMATTPERSASSSPEQQEMPDPADIYRAVEEWAHEMEGALTSNYGIGRKA